MAPRAARKPASSSKNPTGHWYQTLTETEVQRRIDAFIAGAENINNLDECPACLRLFVQVLLESEKLLNHVFQWRPAFFDTALRLIILLKDVNVPALRRQLVGNQLRCRHRMTTHKGPTASRTTDAVSTLLDALFTLISGALKGGPRPLYRTDTVNKKHFCGRKGVWPHALGDLFPAGIERTLDAFVFWMCVPFGGAPFELLQNYLVVVRPVMADALLEGTRRERLAWAILQALTSDPAVPWPSETASPFAPPAGLSVAQDLCGNGVIADEALITLAILEGGRDARRDDMRRFCAGLEAQFLGVLQGFRDSARHGDKIAEYCCMLEDHELASCPRGNLNKAHVVHMYFIHCATSERCSGPDCSMHELGGLEGSESSSTRFQCCAGCRIMRYCNQTCQRAHWEKTAPPHRDVCKVLQRLDKRDVDLFGCDATAFIHAYNELKEDDGELLFRAAASSPFMPYNRHISVGL